MVLEVPAHNQLVPLLGACEEAEFIVETSNRATPLAS